MILFNDGGNFGIDSGVVQIWVSADSADSPASVPRWNWSLCMLARRAACSSSIALAMRERGRAVQQTKVFVWIYFDSTSPGRPGSGHEFVPLYSFASRMRSNAWTTLEEYDFLNELIPQFLSQQEIRVIAPWLAGVVTAFFKKFPSRSSQFDRDRLTSVRFCFYTPPQPPCLSFLETPDMVRKSHSRLCQGNRCAQCS